VKIKERKESAREKANPRRERFQGRILRGNQGNFHGEKAMLAIDGKMS